MFYFTCVHRIIELCLQLWHRSKAGYKDLRDSGFLRLPSERLLQYKKNKVSRVTGPANVSFIWFTPMGPSTVLIPCQSYLIFILLSSCYHRLFPWYHSLMVCFPVFYKTELPEHIFSPKCIWSSLCFHISLTDVMHF